MAVSKRVGRMCCNVFFSNRFQCNCRLWSVSISRKTDPNSNSFCTMFTLAFILHYVSYIFLIGFSVLCLACGLFYLAELVEEYSVLTRKIIKWTISVRLKSFNPKNSFFFEMNDNHHFRWLLKKKLVGRVRMWKSNDDVFVSRACLYHVFFQNFLNP
jgi:hypothetical protein